MSETTQIEQTVTLLLDQLEQGISEQKLNDLDAMVHPRKIEQENDQQHQKDVKDKPNKEEKVSFNPTMVLKNLNEKLDRVVRLFESSDNQQLGLILLKMYLIFHQDDKLEEIIPQLVLKLPISQLETIGVDFVRNTALYMSMAYAKNRSADLRDRLNQTLQILMQIDKDIDLLDCVIEADDLTLLDKFFTPKYKQKMIFYIQQNYFYDQSTYQDKMLQLADYCLSKDYIFDAVRIYLNHNQFDKVFAIYQQCHDVAQQVQLAFFISKINYILPSNFEFHQSKEQEKVIKGLHISEFYTQQLKQLSINYPKSVDEVLHRKDIEIDWVKYNSYVGDFMMNGFINMGSGDDFVFNCHKEREIIESNEADTESQLETAKVGGNMHPQSRPVQLPQGYPLLLNYDGKKMVQLDYSVSVSTASLGLVNMWRGYSENFSFVVPYLQSPEGFVRQGALLASALSAFGQRSKAPFDYLYNILAAHFHQYMTPPKDMGMAILNSQQAVPLHLKQCTVNGREVKNQTYQNQGVDVNEFSHCKEATAALSLGIAYMGSSNQKIIDILVGRLKQSSSDIKDSIPMLEKNPRSFACLALGLVCAGSCNFLVADVILRVIAGHSQQQRRLRFSPLCSIGFALIFLQSGKNQKQCSDVQSYSKLIYEKLQAIRKPDSNLEKLNVSPEENKQSAAFLETLVTISTYTGLGNIQIIRNLIVALTDSIQGRVAAEEAQNIDKLDNTLVKAKTTAKSDSNQQIAEGGQALMIDEKAIWPGDNLEPSTMLVIGLGFLAGDCQICKHMIVRFAERIMKYSDIHAKRAVPFLLAMASVGVVNNELIDDLSKLCLHSDSQTCFNSLLALGIIGCGSQNFKIAGILRHAIESKFYQEDDIAHVIFGAQLAFGLLYAGKGSICMKATSLLQLASLFSVFMFSAPSTEAITRPKCMTMFYLLACAMQPKLVCAVDEKCQLVEVEVRSGRAIEDLLMQDKAFRLAGFATHKTPVVVPPSAIVNLVDEKYAAVDIGAAGVGECGIFVVKQVVQEIQTGSSEKCVKDDLYS